MSTSIPVEGTTVAAEQKRPVLTDKQIVQAATNDPALSEQTAVLGDRTFKIVDLEYDDYLLFLTKLGPLLKGVASGLLLNQGLGGGLDAASIVEYCSSDLPDLACIVCRQTDKDITPKEIKLLAKSPFRLATLVMAQIHRNDMIAEISSFFQLMLPVMKVAVNLSKSKTAETPSL